MKLDYNTRWIRELKKKKKQQQQQKKIIKLDNISMHYWIKNN